MSTATRRSIYGKLAGDSTLTNLLGTPAPGYSQSIYLDPAPSPAVYPFIVFSKSTGMPTEAFGKYPSTGFRSETETWLVKAVDHNTTADTAEAISSRIQVLLNDANLSISGGTIMYLRRQSDIDYPEVVDGELFRHSGALYRLMYS